MTRSDGTEEDVQRSKEMRLWADEAMYQAQPMQVARTPDGGIIPQVHLLWMTPDPLGAMAAMYRMYRGEVAYELSSITDAERAEALDEVQKTHLKAPLEAVELQFLVEGVTRSFTHQMVRQRTAVYAQESMRFAVKEEPLTDICSLPPSLAGTAAVEHDPPMHPTQKQQWREKWDDTLKHIDETYHYLINSGMPAEDARGLMPHAVTTRLVYKTNLRNLAEHAGNRLCTQAQFEWRIVFMGIVQEIRNYLAEDYDTVHTAWQFQAIADSGLFRPVCYALGRCPFKANVDRACTIRKRVDHFEAAGVPSIWWADPDRFGEEDRIQMREWLLDPSAARVASGGGGHD